MAENILSRQFMVKPSECNANGELPLTTLVAQIIDIATDHANQLGIGFLELGPHGLGWVLSRLSVEMKRWPKNGESYRLSTWIESYNAHFSERCFSIITEDGEVIGYSRTIWVIIYLENHMSAGTAGTLMPDEMIAAIPCPIPKMVRTRPFTPQVEVEYIFKYTDLDFYRHVNTVRYISLLLNQFTLAEFDTHLLSRFDIAFAHEAKYGETALIKSKEEPAANPSMAEGGKQSVKRVFEIVVDERQVLTSSIVLTEL